MNTTIPMSNNESRHIIVVDTYGAASRLAPAFHAAGYTTIRVQSTPAVPKVYRGRPDPFPFVADIVHRGDLVDTLNALLPFDPVAVIPGCEPGVELADALSEALNPLTGAPTNGTALSSARRNKYEMIERIKQQGLRGARQILVESEDQLREWHTELSGMAILKPLRSSSNDAVTWCRTPDDSVRAFRRLNGRENINSEAGDGHVEIKMTPDGPCLVEVGARMAGQDVPGYAALAIEESQVDWMVDAYVRPHLFKQRRGHPYRLHRSIAWAKKVAPLSGMLVSYRGLQAIKELESFRDIRFQVHPGQRLARTVDDSTYPVTVTLLHEVADILLRDLWTLRYIDGEHFYELADDTESDHRNTLKGITS